MAMKNVAQQPVIMNKQILYAYLLLSPELSDDHIAQIIDTLMEKTLLLLYQPNLILIAGNMNETRAISRIDFETLLHSKEIRPFSKCLWAEEFTEVGFFGNEKRVTFTFRSKNTEAALTKLVTLNFGECCNLSEEYMV